MRKVLAALGGVCVLGSAALTVPPALAAPGRSPAVTSRAATPVVAPQYETLCHNKPFVGSAEPTFHAALPDDATPRTGVSIQFRLTRAIGGEPRRSVVSTATVDTYGSGVANWTPDYSRLGDLEDGQWAVAAREIVTPADGGRQQVSRWSAAERFKVDTAVPATPTITLNSDGSLTIESAGAAGFVWSFGGPLASFTSGEEICTVTSGDSNSGTVPANRRGVARLVTGMTGPMFFTVAAYGPSDQRSDAVTQIIGFPG